MSIKVTRLGGRSEIERASGKERECDRERERENSIGG